MNADDKEKIMDADVTEHKTLLMCVDCGELYMGRTLRDKHGPECIYNGGPVPEWRKKIRKRKG